MVVKFCICEDMEIENYDISVSTLLSSCSLSLVERFVDRLEFNLLQVRSLVFFNSNFTCLLWIW